MMYFDGQFIQLPESSVEKIFDEFIESTGLFFIERQVVGRYLYGSTDRVGRKAIIDRVLIPNKYAVTNLGIKTGPIGVEIKASDKELKWGPPITQAIDYRSASFRLFDDSYKFDCVLDAIFLFPMDNQGGQIESIMAQNRIGHARVAYGNKMVFAIGSAHVLQIQRDNSEVIFNSAWYDVVGRKFGSR